MKIKVKYTIEFEEVYDDAIPQKFYDEKAVNFINHKKAIIEDLKGWNEYENIEIVKYEVEEI